MRSCYQDSSQGYRPGVAPRRRWLLHGLAWTMGIASFRIGLVPAQACRAVIDDEIAEAISLSAGWIATNVRSDGSYTYRYDRSTGEDLGGYNLVRHAALVNALYQAADLGDDRWLDVADQGLDFMLARQVHHQDWVAFARSPSDVQLGATSLFVAALIHRRRATGDRMHDDRIHEAARFLIAQQDSSGAPYAYWDPGTESPVPDRFGPFATGESAWALALAESDFPGVGYGDASDAVLSYIVNDRRNRENLILRLPDHWASYALAERDRPLDDAELSYVERLAGDFALMSRVEAQRTGDGIQSVIRFGHALGAGVGAMGEGTAGLWRIAHAGNGLAGSQDDLADRVECVTALLVDRQVQADDVVSDAGAEVGAWFKQDVTQMDDQQHTLSSLLLARVILSDTVERS